MNELEDDLRRPDVKALVEGLIMCDNPCAPALELRGQGKLAELRELCRECEEVDHGQ